MIPRTFPSTFASNGQQQMVVYFLTSVTGLQKWSDYIPVKLSSAGPENSYSGFIDVAVLPSLTTDTQAWKEYIPVYQDDSATDAWAVNAVGYIPYSYALFGDASLMLDMTNGGVLDPRVTFTRASTATRVNASGVVESVAIDGPRFDYDPVTLAPKGLLIEEQRTNLVWPSADFSGASWTKSNIAPASGSVTAPDGSVCGAYAGSDPSNVLKRLRFNLSTTTAGTYTWSIYLKAGTEDTCAFNLQDGTGSNGTVLTARLTDGVITVAPSVYGTATGQSASIQPVGNGFFRLSISVNFVSALTQIQAILTWDGNGASTTTGTLFPWGAQLEVGAFPTSYIPTTTAAATRAADVAVMTGANFSNWYRQDEGTVYAEGGSVGNAGSLFAASDGSFNNFIAHLFQFGTTSRSWVYQGGVAQALISNNASGAIKHALSYATDDIRHSVNGAAVVLDASAVTPSVNQLSIGSRVTANNLNGHIRRISYFPRRLSDAELQGITL